MVDPRVCPPKEKIEFTSVRLIFLESPEVGSYFRVTVNLLYARFKIESWRIRRQIGTESNVMDLGV
jgi:hypothetical protein